MSPYSRPSISTESSNCPKIKTLIKNSTIIEKNFDLKFEKIAVFASELSNHMNIAKIAEILGQGRIIVTNKKALTNGLLPRDAENLLPIILNSLTIQEGVQVSNELKFRVRTRRTRGKSKTDMNTCICHETSRVN